MKKEQKTKRQIYYLTELYEKNKHYVTSYVLDKNEYDGWKNGNRKLEEVSVYDIWCKNGKGFLLLDDTRYSNIDIMLLPVSIYMQWIKEKNEKNK